ncbi:MAG: hypothetical protein EOO22_15050, partial [Comamonadaceae bacterium]
MVAIVSGNSLGLGQTSLATLGQSGRLGDALQGRSGEAAYVNVATGNLVLQTQDDLMVVAGTDIAAIRTYNSRGLADDDNGDNWRMSLSRPPLVVNGTVNAAGSSIVLTAGDGAVAVYAFDAGQKVYTSTEGDGAYDTISYAEDTRVYTWTDGRTNATERYTRATDKDGNDVWRLTASLDSAGKGFTYTYQTAPALDGLLAKAKPTSGDATYFVYDANRCLTAVKTGATEASATAVVSYGYDGSKRLSKVTVALDATRSYTTDYTYDGTSTRIASVTQSDGSKLTIVYEPTGARRVTSVSDALDRETKFAYGTAGAGGLTVMTVTDPLERVTSYTRLGGHTNRIARMIRETRHMEFVTTRTETEALLLEANLIKRLRPRFNVLLRDD